MLKNFIIRDNKADNFVLDGIFDFVVIGFVSICFSNFGQAIVDGNIKNMIFSCANIALVSANWYTYIFYSTRYQDKTPFHVTVMWVTLIFSVLYGVGIKAYYLTDNQLSINFITIGYVLSRVPVAIIFLFIDLANKDQNVTRLVRWKYLSRLLNIAIILVNMYFKIIDFKYLFVIIAFGEIFGNVIQVRKKYMNNLPNIDYDYSMSRFTKLNSLYIGCILIASIGFYSTYVNKINPVLIIEHLVAIVSLGFLLWISYYQRVIKYDLKYNAKSIILFSTFGILIDIGFSTLGSLMLYANQIIKVNPNLIYGAMLCIVTGMVVFLFAAHFKKTRIKIKTYKFIEYYIYMLILLIGILFHIGNSYAALVICYLILTSMIINYYIQEYIVKKFIN